MRLVVDTSVLVGELLRVKGRQRLEDDRLELFLPDQMWIETTVELPRRIAAFARARRLEPGIVEELTSICLGTVRANITVIDKAVYAAAEDESLARSQRDPDDWPAVACALMLSAGIWTNDNDYLGTGVPTWTTETLQIWLDRNRVDDSTR